MQAVTTTSATTSVVADPNPHNRFTTFGNGHRLIGFLLKIELLLFESIISDIKKL